MVQARRERRGIMCVGVDDCESYIRYHKGNPVFHDGEKYWSCCPQKKCIDFESFIKVPGCVTGKHDDGRN